MNTETVEKTLLPSGTKSWKEQWKVLDRVFLPPQVRPRGKMDNSEIPLTMTEPTCPGVLNSKGYCMQNRPGIYIHRCPVNGPISGTVVERFNPGIIVKHTTTSAGSLYDK